MSQEGSSKRIRTLLTFIDEPNRTGCLNVLVELEKEPLASAPGSKHNHQAWSGGYLDHVAETMRVAVNVYESLTKIRPLSFSLSDALLIMFLHDLEKPYKYGRGIAIPKSMNNSFRLEKIESFQIALTSEQLNALKYVEGENDDYAPGQRIMGPLAAFCHMCDVCSARIWFNEPSH